MRIYHGTPTPYLSRFFASLCIGAVCALFGTTAIAADTVTGADSPSGTTRYVWANNLIMRAAPDSKSAEILKLPSGMAVTLVPDSSVPIRHGETLLKLAAHPDDRMVAGNIVMDGNWQHVHASDRDGWVFDGYLSRYPYPEAVSKNKLNNGAALAFIKQRFGVKLSQHWEQNDGVKARDYQAMSKHIQSRKDPINEQDVESWDYIELQHGISYELINYGEAGAVSEHFKNLPFTFNEALLFARQFSVWNSIDPKIAETGEKIETWGKFNPGHSFEVDYIVEDWKTDRVECNGQRCDVLNDDHGD